MDADDARNNAADLRGRIELALALAAFGCEVPHEVFIGIAEDIITVRAVLAEIERLVFEDGNEVREAIHHFLATAELGLIVEVGHVR